MVQNRLRHRRRHRRQESRIEGKVGGDRQGGKRKTTETEVKVNLSKGVPDSKTGMLLNLSNPTNIYVIYGADLRRLRYFLIHSYMKMI